MYSQIRSLTGCVRESAFIARSISPIMPSWGDGRCPERIILAVVTEPSGPRIGDDERPVVSSERGRGSESERHVQ
jgi:hypothetical protein